MHDDVPDVEAFADAHADMHRVSTHEGMKKPRCRRCKGSGEICRRCKQAIGELHTDCRCQPGSTEPVPCPTCAGSRRTDLEAR